MEGRSADRPRDDAFRSVAQLDMLHNLAARLNAMGGVDEVAEAITLELESIIDYHNCRVYLLLPDGQTLRPIAFRGELSSEYAEETYEELVTKVGEGITGWVAEHRESLLTPDAREVDFAVTIPGTDDDLLESMLAVPMLAGDAVVGVIVLSSLGYGIFDVDDQRLLEVLASHAAVAFQNAQLFEAEREAAETSSALLRLSQSLTRLRSVGDILQEAIETAPSIVTSAAVAAYVRDAETDSFRIARVLQLEEQLARPRAEIADIPREIAERFLFAGTDPFRVPVDAVRDIPSDAFLVSEAREVLVAPLRWTPDGMGAIVLVAPTSEATFGDRDLRVARGIADLASLALGTARRISDLQRFHELVDSLDAVFWEADATTLELTFMGGRPEQLLGASASRLTAEGLAWDRHIAAADREGAVAACRAAVADARDVSIEYRVETSDGSTRWIRDLVHVERRPQRPPQLRGLMIDVTERRLAEETLAKSERKYSEAFRREREAAQRLRTLDEMKNTFLEAVSHDLRTPLTSILGSALTLEQSQLQLPSDDALDLVRRIATNARKLERLLGDLLDLDRLQRGIVSPQRRPTDLAELVRRGVEETENLTGRPIEADAESVTVSVDAAKVERILENLLSNALRHTPSDAYVWVRARAQDGGVSIVVEDEGPGVPDDHKLAVFEAFRQAPGSSSGHSPGVGIGLSLVKRFAELHGGRAWVTDREGGGAAFHVFLPGG
jgi:signal transduction histidine kinase/GAF domain-containing protein